MPYGKSPHQTKPKYTIDYNNADENPWSIIPSPGLPNIVPDNGGNVAKLQWVLLVAKTL